jgi:tRNA-splicing endonuclease subunit Sen54
MADEKVDEDAPITSLHVKGNTEDNDPTDELPDFRFLAALTPNSKGTLPKRGEKDFEPHGTRHQDAILDASRKAMHEALDYTRVHLPKSQRRAWYFGEGVVDNNTDEAEDQGVLSEAIRGRGLSRDHVVLVDIPRGTHFRTMGKAPLGLKQSRIWLLPEEALYLVERGNLDMWWPSRPLSAIRGYVTKQDVEIMEQNDDDGGNDEEEEEEGEGEDDGLPLSLQAAYALLVGEDEERGKVSLDRYTVYANLKRTGYVVLRAETSHNPPPGAETVMLADRVSKQAANLFALLFGGIFKEKLIDLPSCGPLIQPGLYRSYNDVYRRLAVVPRHVPSQHPSEQLPSPEYPIEVVFNVWKPTRIPTFAKSDPGLPDFRIAIVSARSTDTPSLIQLTDLLEGTPWDPPKMEGPAKRYQRLKHGWRNVILAVVDQGIISYLRVSESAFGEEKLYGGFDRGGLPGGKRGGGGRGRGRGGRSGRGGRGRGR